MKKSWVYVWIDPVIGATVDKKRLAESKAPQHILEQQAIAFITELSNIIEYLLRVPSLVWLSLL
ncbi:MAG: hypothetical protein WC647_15240 [Desulfomonilaceae bacterium]